MARQTQAVWVLCLLVWGAVLYGGSLRTPFLWDEDSLIVNEPRTHDWSRLPDIFTKPFLSGTSGFARYYRPLITVSFRIDHKVWGLNPVGYHLTNLLFHLANTLLVYVLFLRFFKQPGLSFWGAFLFLAHPAHVEAVTYIPGRVDLISFFFVLCGFYGYLAGRDSARKSGWYLLSAVCYGAALFSKEMAAFFPLAILAHALLIDREKTKFKGAEGALLLGMAFLLAGFILVRQTVSVRIPLKALLDLPRLPLRLFVVPEILFNYAKIWFFPWPLQMERVVLIDVLNVKILAVEWALLLLSLVSAFLLFRKGIERFWFFWIGVTLLPVLQIVPIYMSWRHLFIAEHFLYFSSPGIIALLMSRFGPLVAAEEGVRLPRSCGVLVLGAVLTCFSCIVIWRNGEFRDRITFFERTVRQAPWSFRAYNQLGLAYLKAGYPEEAQEAFETSISLEPNDGIPYVNLGFLASNRGDYEKAKGYFQKTLELMPGDSVALNNLGVLEFQKGHWRKAIAFFDQAIQGEPGANMCTYSSKGHAYWELGEKEKALEAIGEGLRVDPSSPLLLNIKRWIEGRLREGRAVRLKSRLTSPNRRAVR